MSLTKVFLPITSETSGSFSTAGSFSLHCRTFSYGEFLDPRGLRGKDAKMQKVNNYKKVKNFSLFTYYLLVVIRVVLVFIPQHGYIHPDEFFQTAEIISGNLSEQVIFCSSKK